MPQAVWVGHLSFGLVNMPVKLYGATAPKDVRFHHYEAETGRRIRYRRVATGPPSEPPPPSEGAEPGSPPRLTADEARREAAVEVPGPSGDDAEVPWEDIVKGFEVEPGRVVTVSPEELRTLAPERSRVLEVEQFVDLAEVDPVHFEKSYYVVPQTGMGAERPYWLLYRAMEAAGRVAVGRFVLRTREHLAAIRPADHVLVLETLFYADEVRDPKEMWVPLVEEPPEREVGVARQLIEALAAEWRPARHRDEYRERVLDLLRTKAGDAFVVPEPEVEVASPAVVDLMEALEASVEAAKRARAEERKRTGSAEPPVVGL
jgi:DNA end-binding protein Ku